MTKRNLLLVGLFLVFGLATMATSALASTAWVPATSASASGRSEGYAEETGIYSLTNNVAGPVAVGDYFTVTYNYAVVTGSVYIVCTGPDFINQPSCSPYITATASGAVVTLKFATAITFATTGDEIALTVRVDATKVPCGTDVTAVGASFNTTAATTSGHTISIAGAPQSPDVLFVNCEPTLSLTFGTEHGKAELTAAYVLTCLGVKEIGEYENDFTLNVDEEFANALTSFSYEYGSDPDATTGTTFTIVFTNVPTQVTLDEVDIKPCATLWTGNPLYCPTGTLDVVLDPSTPHKGGSISGTTVSFTFDVTMEDNNMPESVDIKFVFWSHGPLPPGLPQMVANVFKGRLGPPSGTPLAPIPSFTEVLEGKSGTPWNLSVVEFTDCITSLLFPYVTDTYGFNTGLAISNTTLDPFNVPSPADSPAGPNPLDLKPYYGKGSAVPQTGPCQFYLFADGMKPWAATAPTATINPGQTRAWDMGGLFGYSGTGYAIAVCDFQNADGYAFIYYSLGLSEGVAANYLAYVIPSPQWYHRTPGGDFLGEFAIAPLSVNRHLAWKSY